MNRRYFLLTLVAALAVASVLGCGKKAAAPVASAGTPVLVETVKEGQLQDVITLTGTAQADQDTTLNTELAGNIAAVYVRVGDRVSAGQPVVGPREPGAGALHRVWRQRAAH